MDYPHIRSRFRISHIEKLYKNLLAEKSEEYSKHPQKFYYTMIGKNTLKDYLDHFALSVETDHKYDKDFVRFHVQYLNPLLSSPSRVLTETITWIPSSNQFTAPGFGLHSATPDMLDRMIRSIISGGLKNWCYIDVCF